MTKMVGNSCLLVEAFPEAAKGPICSAYFSTTDLTEKTWYDFETLAKADDVTFWTVIAHHKKLSHFITAGLSKIDHAQHSTSPAVRRGVKKSHMKALTSVLLRMGCDTAECVRRRVDVADLARKINTLLPLKQFLIFNASVIQLRHGILACVAGCSFHMVNPLYLCNYPTLLLEWREVVDQIVKRCVKELGRGRYQRLSGDILILFEQTYRVVKSLWALLSSCPYIADYLPVSTVLRGLRIVVDVVSPLLQHFLLHCDTLSTRRELLSKLNAGIINASLSAAMILLLFRSFCTDIRSAGDNKNTEKGSDSQGEGGGGAAARGETAFLLLELVQTVEERLRESAEVYLRGYSRLLLNAAASISSGAGAGSKAMGSRGNVKDGERERRREGSSRCCDGSTTMSLHSIFSALWKPPSLSPEKEHHRHHHHPQLPQQQQSPPLQAAKGVGQGGIHERRIGEVLLELKNPVIADSGDFASACPKRQRFFQLILAELANQEVPINHSLLHRGLLNPEELEALEGCQQAVLCALAGIPVEDPKTVASPPTPQSASGERGGQDVSRAGEGLQQTTTREENGSLLPPSQGTNIPPNTSASPSPVFPPGSLEACVLEVLPHFSVSAVEAALKHYNEDIEQLITDALIDNLPPHLSSAMQKSQSDEMANESNKEGLDKRQDGSPQSVGPLGVEDEVFLLEGTEKAKYGLEDVQLVFHPGALRQSSNDPSPFHLSNEDFDDALQLRDLSLFFWDGNSDSSSHKKVRCGSGSIGEGEEQDDEEEGEGDEDDETRDRERREDEGEEEGPTDYVTYNREGEQDTWGWSSSPAKAFQVSEEMKDRIRLLSDMMMYEDELDDEGMQEVEMRNPNRPTGTTRAKKWSREDGNGECDSGEDDEEDNDQDEDEHDEQGEGGNRHPNEMRNGGVERAAEWEAAVDSGWKVQGKWEKKMAPGAYNRPPRSDYDKKMFYGRREKDRASQRTEGTTEGGGQTSVMQSRHGEGRNEQHRDPENRPAYTKKNKTVKSVKKAHPRGRAIPPF